MEKQEAQSTIVMKRFVAIDLRSNRGITVIEIMIALAIVMVLIYAGRNFLYKKTRYLLKSESRKLSSLIEQLYHLAIVRNQVHRLCLDLDKEIFWVEAQGADGKFLKSNKSYLKPQKLPTEVSFQDVFDKAQSLKKESGITCIHFFSHGYAEPVSIHLIDNEKKAYTLQIQPLTGDTLVQAAYR